jgi:hypothetical protein
MGIMPETIDANQGGEWFNIVSSRGLGGQYYYPGAY